MFQVNITVRLSNGERFSFSYYEDGLNTNDLESARHDIRKSFNNLLLSKRVTSFVSCLGAIVFINMGDVSTMTIDVKEVTEDELRESKPI